MPVIGIPVNKLLNLLDKDIDKDVLLKALEQLGCDVEGYTTYRRFACTACGGIMEITETEEMPVTCQGCGNSFRDTPQTIEYLEDVEVIRMELLAVRPDMFDPGGLSRVLKGFFDMELGLPEYKMEPPTLKVTVDKTLSDPENYRPFIACAVIKNVHLDTEFIRIVMKLQENLHWAMGRNRKNSSIGIYDLNTVRGGFRYTALDPDNTRFRPLGTNLPGQVKEFAGREILETHPKGMEYSYLLEGFKKYPFLIDSNNRVLSMPPIINSEETKVTPRTTSFFIDVTGTNERIVNKTLNVLTTSLLDLDKNLVLHQVKIDYPDKPRITPDFSIESCWVSKKETCKILGINLTADELVNHLLRMRHGVGKIEYDRVEVMVAPYRNDIIHQRDLMEDIGISYGYHNIPRALVKTMTVGQELPVETLSRIARKIMTGLGFYEVINLVLTCEKRNFDDLNIERHDNIVRISNPVSPQYTMVRGHLLPGILDTFQHNRDHELPQKIFEIGDISILDANVETGARETRKIAGGVIGPKTGYSEIRSTVESLLHEFNMKLVVKPVDHPSFIPGRVAEVHAKNNNGDKKVGIMGEIHPEILGNFSLVHPVAVFELDLPG